MIGMIAEFFFSGLEANSIYGLLILVENKRVSKYE